MLNIFQILAGLGIILISLGILTRKRKNADLLHILGGLSLVSYSINIKDPFFITLQIIFIIVAIYDFSRKRKK
ncbi:hypothetical protein COU54_05780 [Candidatus Pacearchaeota archaeon CG10_big_fil_rev_8_21_14_0_10_31_24]|nr:MAG: hypothetical protein COU54_05780 [Candidatus Pacearchaeota archaeon CG10_big_fil_rev_8_21_14_0_10_31_24]